MISADFKSFLTFKFVFFFSVLLQAQTPPVVYVAGDGSGDYNCDGIADQVEINQALNWVATHPDYTTVYLKGAYTYIIDEPVLISSNTILTGNSSATVKLVDSANWWTQNKALFTQTGRTTWDAYGNASESVEQVEIFGFSIDGGNQQEPAGSGYYGLIHFTFPQNIRIHDMKFYGGLNDAVRLSAAQVQYHSNSRVYNNYIYDSGHDAISFVNLKQCYAFNNKIIKTRTNSGIRATHSDSIYFYNNLIGNSLAKSPAGFAGIQILNEYEDRPFSYGEIYNNMIYGKNEGIHVGENNSIYPTGTMKNLYIHHNRIYKIKSSNTSTGELIDGGIVVSGFQNTLIEHNAVEGCETDAIVYRGNAGGGNAYQTIVRNNILINNAGYGINNEMPAVNTFVADNNLLFNNALANYNNLTANNDIHTDPLFGEPHTSFGQWHHIVATYDNTSQSMKIYVDGMEKSSRILSGFGNIGSNNYHLVLADYWDYYWFNGLMDELAIWDRALLSNEVNTLFNDGNPQPINANLLNGLQAYYKMDNDWNDASGNNNDAVSATAGFSANAVNGTHSGWFDGVDDEVVFSDSLSSANGISISVWINRNLIDDNIQTILNKGKQTQNNHIWLYFKDESLIFELGNGNMRKSLEAYIINPEDIDYHIKSEYGRWKSGDWIIDNISSPCLDAGYPASDFSLEPEPNGGVVNIGVYGNSLEASLSNISAVDAKSLPSVWMIYPNPVDDILFVSKELVGKKYIITSISGQIIQEGNTKEQINVSKLKKGIYLIEWQQKKLRLKIIKK